MSENTWQKCVICKNGISFTSNYYKCSISSCSSKRAPTQFCSVTCWDVHSSMKNHMSAGADEFRAPSKEKFLSQREPVRKKVIKTQSVSTSKENDEILVVVSKLKNYVKEELDLNTSADVMPILSDVLRRACREASKNSKNAERKTLMARDFL